MSSLRSLSGFLLWFLLSYSSFQRINSSFITNEISFNNYNTRTFSSCQSIGSNYYFDSTLLNCVKCPTNQTASTTIIDATGNSAGCQCAAGFQYVGNNTCAESQDTSGKCLEYTCVSCLHLNKVSSSDGSVCMGCGVNTTGISSSTHDCDCKSNKYVLIEKNVLGNYLPEKYCALCPSGTFVITQSGLIAGQYYYANSYTCQSCPDPLMTMSYSNGAYSCRCPTGYTIVGVSGIGAQSCVITSLATNYIQELSTAVIVFFQNDDEAYQQIDSLTIEHYFVLAATKCQYYWTIDSFRYCQILANLCVLSLYKLNGPVCEAHINLLTQDDRSLISQYNISNWVNGMPWIFYDFNVDGLVACQQNIYSNLVSLRQDQLTYVVASYFLNGTFRGLQTLQTLLSFCQRSAPNTDQGGGDSSSTSWQYYGYNFDVSYQCEIRSLLNQVPSVDEQLFYELFLYDPVTLKYAPVPVRVKNMISANMRYYTYDLLCDKPDQLVRRFFLFDVVSGRESITGDPTTIRVASRIYFQTERVRGTQNTIYPTVLTISYAQYQPSQWTMKDEQNYNGETDVIGHFEILITYTIDLSYFEKTFLVFAIILFIIMIGYFILRFYNWNKRTSRVITAAQLTSDLGALNFENIINIILLLMNSYVLVFFPVTLLISWYFFVFYKLQSVPSILLPPMIQILSIRSPYFIFVIQLHVLACFQMTYVIYCLVYRQGKFHLYLIDWEPAKHKHVPSTSAAANQKIAGNATVSAAMMGSGGSADTHQISIWRTVLVANKLLDIQVARKSNIIFTLFWIGYFMIGLGLDNNDTNQPSLDELNNANSEYPVNIVLRFANTTFFWLAISFFQYGWNYFIYEAYFSEPIEQKFIDFCTILKISMFILDEKYHGYYLHCHSSIQYADINMLEVINMLSHEENGLLMDRALENAPIDIQSFELFLSGEWFEEYMKLYYQLLQIQSVTDILEYRRQQQSEIQQRSFGNSGNTTRRGGGRGGGGGSGGEEQNSIWKTAARYNRLNSGNSSKHHKGLKLGYFYYSHVPNEKLYSSWENLINFLKEFINNNYSKSYLRYNIKERNYYEYMTNDAPDLSFPNQPSVLVTDTSSGNYTKCFFYGNELDLLLFNILTYSIYDLWFNNTMISILLCYLSNWGITYWRYHLGKVTMSKHGLIDSRFLFP